MSKRVINAPENVVVEMLDGMVACHSHLRRLDGFPHVKVLLHGERDTGKVAVISGGGSGHEPWSAGLVGPGLLAAAVAGDVFASPPAEAILAAIRAVASPAGVLLLVANYTGDRLNTGLALEQAKAEGIPVEMLVVGDDCSLPDKGAKARRGLAGTGLVIKIACAMAAEGAELAQIVREASAAAAALGSCGLATTVCTVPGAKPSARIGADEMELGLGIHGEPGARRQPMCSADEAAAQMLEAILEPSHNFFEAPVGCNCALMVNNLGCTPIMELYVVARAALRWLHQHQVAVARVLVGSFCTSLDMQGLSLSLLRLDEPRWLHLLDAPAQAPGWASMVTSPPNTAEPVPMPKGQAQASTCSRDRAAWVPQAEQAVRAASQALIAEAAQLDDWDSRVGDGDCGTTVKRGANAFLQALDKGSFSVASPEAFAAACAAAARCMGGSSGALYDILFTAAAGSFQQQEGSSGLAACAAAFQAGVEAIQRYGGAGKGDRTMLDALLPAADALSEAVSSGKLMPDALEAAAEAAAKGAAATESMDAGAGRAQYIPGQSLQGVPDPGAMAAACWLKAVATAVQP